MTYQKKSHASEASHELNPWTCMDLDELFGSSRRYAVDSISLLLSLSSPPLLSLSDISLTAPSKSHFERQQLYDPFVDTLLWMELFRTWMQLLRRWTSCSVHRGDMLSILSHSYSLSPLLLSFLSLTSLLHLHRRVILNDSNFIIRSWIDGSGCAVRLHGPSRLEHERLRSSTGVFRFPGAL